MLAIELEDGELDLSLVGMRSVYKLRELDLLEAYGILLQGTCILAIEREQRIDLSRLSLIVGYLSTLLGESIRITKLYTQEL